MIYFVTGEDREKVSKTAHGLTDILQKKRPGALLFRMTGDDWNKDSFDGTATGQGLFESKYIIVLDSLFKNEEAAEYLENKLEDLKKADHAFVFIEYGANATTKKLLKKYSEKVWEVETHSVPKGTTAGQEKFNIFSLTDALGERNQIRLWSLYQKALMSGSEPEEIHGILFWQIKSLLLAAQSKTADEAGLKPFVWSKAQRFLKNYSTDELKKISSNMVDFYHLSRIESGSLEDSLEEFVIGVGR